VTLIYFVPDQRKAGGSYQTIRGRVKKLTQFPLTIVFEDDRAVSVSALLSLELEE
jgi:hypothetical protein